MKYLRERALIIIFILVALAFPLVADASDIAVEVLLLTAAAAAWNFFSGYTGYISLGQAAFYGFGSYTLTLACQKWHLQGDFSLFLLLPVAGLVASIFSLPLGWIALRTRRYTFMVITIAFFFIFQLLAYNLRGLTAGSSGIFLPTPDWDSNLANIPFYYVALALLLLIVFVSWRLRHTQYGLVLLAIRDDEDRVRSLGHWTERHKLGAYALSAFFIGMIGALAAYFSGYISPSSAFDQTLDVTIVAMTFFGGIGSIWGPIVGGLLLEPLQAYLTQQFSSTAASLNQIIFGCLLLLVLLLFPQGVVPSLHKRWLAWKAARAEVDSGLATLAGLNNSLALSLANAAISSAQMPPVPNYQSVAPVAIPSVQAAQCTPERNMEIVEPTYVALEQSVPAIPEHPAEQLEAFYPLSQEVDSTVADYFAGQHEERHVERFEPIVNSTVADYFAEQHEERNSEQFEPLYTVPPRRIAPSIPERPGEQFNPSSLAGVLKSQRMRASRLVHIRSDNAPSVQKQDAPAVSWRCPNCKIPFLLNGDICYCRRCGLVRSLDTMSS
jgi:branched-chain amino acid transport system permease protein